MENGIQIQTQGSVDTIIGVASFILSYADTMLLHVFFEKPHIYML